MAQRDFADEIDAIRTDLGSLREDIGKLVGAAGRSASVQVRDGAERMRESADLLMKRGRKGAVAVGRQIEHHPYASLFTALSVGMVLGRLLDKRLER